MISIFCAASFHRDGMPVPSRAESLGWQDDGSRGKEGKGSTAYRGRVEEKGEKEGGSTRSDPKIE